MGIDQRVRALVAHCDVEERVRTVPASALYRGLYFKNIVTVLKEANVFERYDEIYPESYSAVRWYSLAAYMERLAVAGALLKGAENVHEGMREIGHHNATSFAESLLGRTMLRFLARDPMKLLRQACAGRRQSCTYGRWEVRFPEPQMAVMEMFEEYLWMESHAVGAAEGTFESIGLKATIEVQLDSALQGRHLIRWR